MNIILATTNPGKQQEMQRMLEGIQATLLLPPDTGQTLNVVEDGETFAENALKKARAYVDWYGEAALADDSGLEIDALDGEPGVKSRRWIGDGRPESELVPELLKRMAHLGPDERGAQFRTAVALALPDGRYFIEEGVLRGVIADVSSDQIREGLPYRQIFYIPEHGKRYADLTPQEELALENHRMRALKRLLSTVDALLAETN